MSTLMAAMVNSIPLLQRWSSAPAKVEEPPTAPCAVCFDAVELAQLVSLCDRSCDARLCGSCVDAYLRDRTGGDRGFACCPRVECPGAGCRVFVPMDKWRAHVHEDVWKRYETNAGVLLSVRCQSCDGTKTVLPDHDPEAAVPAPVAEAVTAATKALMAGAHDAPRQLVDAAVAHANAGGALGDIEARIAALEAQLAAGHLKWRQWMGARDSDIRALNGEATRARKRFGRAKEARRADPESKEAEQEVLDARAASNVIQEQRSKAMEEMRGTLRLAEINQELRQARGELERLDPVGHAMSAILVTVKDPERRAAVMLHYLTRYPDVRTLCHQRVTCFRCKVAGGHPGVSCADYQDQNLPKEVRQCPGCSVAFVRGDGCSSITCMVCSHRFTWSDATVIA